MAATRLAAAFSRLTSVAPGRGCVHAAWGAGGSAGARWKHTPAGEVHRAPSKNGLTPGGHQRTLRCGVIAIKKGMSTLWDVNGAHAPLTLTPRPARTAPILLPVCHTCVASERLHM